MPQLIEIKKNTRIFPLREGVDISDFLRTLSQPPEIHLTPEEKRDVLTFEKILTESKDLYSEIFPERFRRRLRRNRRTHKKILGIEECWKLKVNSVDFYLEYFFSREGINDLRKHMGYGGSGTRRDTEKFLSSGQFNEISAKTINEVSGRSRAYVISKMVQEFEESDFSSSQDVHNPTKLTVIKNPDALVKQYARFVNLKTYLEYLRLSFEKQNDSFSKAILVVVEVHNRRLEELIAQQYPLLVSFIEQAYISEIDYYAILLERLKSINKARFQMFEDFAKTRTQVLDGLHVKQDVGSKFFERIDKFVNGVGEPHNNEYTVFSKKLKRLVRMIETHSASEFSENEGKSGSEAVFSLKEQNKLKTITVSALKFQEWAKRALSEYGLLSEESDGQYSVDRVGRAKDGKWQVIIDPTREALAVDDRQGVLKVPKKLKRKIFSNTSSGAVAILDHEIAHILQHENKRKIELSIVKHVGMDRASIYKEGGAVSWENDAKRKLFGCHKRVDTHYFSAIQARSKQGTLSDCALAFYKSYVNFSGEDIDREKVMRLAIDRSMRIFRNGGVFNDVSRYVTNSQPLVYIEQKILAEELEGSGAEKVLMVADVNIEMLAALHKVGLLDLSSIHVPRKRPSAIILDDVKGLLEKIK